jgi:hypothetical protein
METIKNYLEAMFANMPNTPAVQKAKKELGQMMEDKYSELLAEGKSENEAVGTVISEFGNLEELSEELGVKEEFQQEQQEYAGYHQRQVTLEEAEQYIHAHTRHANRIALGVFFCILSLVGPILSDALDGFALQDSLGILVLMLCIAAGVFLFVYDSLRMEPWKFIKQEPCFIDYQTATYLQAELEQIRSHYAIIKTIGILLCILCWLPAVLLDDVADAFPMMQDFIDTAEAALLFLLAGLGVFFIIQSSKILSGYQKLLCLNDQKVSGSPYAGETMRSGTPYAKENEEVYINDTLTDIMSLYWPTITCIYLCWSFLSFDWYISWIIWPIAAIIHRVIKMNLGKKS